MQTNYSAPAVPRRQSVGVPIPTPREGARANYTPANPLALPPNDFREDAQAKHEAEEKRKFEARRAVDKASIESGEHAKLHAKEQQALQQERKRKAALEATRRTAASQKSSQPSVSSGSFYSKPSSSSAKTASGHYPTLEVKTGFNKNPISFAGTTKQKQKLIDISSPDSSPEKKRKPQSTDSKAVKKPKNALIDLSEDSPVKPKRIASPPRSVSPVDWKAYKAAKAEKLEAEEAEEAKAKRAEQRKAKKGKSKFNKPAWDSDSEPDDDSADEYEQAMREQEELERNGGEFDMILQRDLSGPDPSVPLCPFCSAPLPLEPSARLLRTKEVLLARPTIQKAPTMANPGGMRLPVEETAGFCSLHSAETTTIPEGIARGWPTEIDFIALAKRVKEEKIAEYLIKVITRQTPSEFYTAAVEQLEAQGNRRMGNVLAELETFEIEQPGYYGPQGYEHLMKALEKHFVDTCCVLSSSSASPLPIEAYLRKVLVPEAAISLIAQDQNCTRLEASAIRKESVGFGFAVFGMSAEEEEFLAEEMAREYRETREKEERIEAEAKGKSQEKEKKEEEKKKKRDGVKRQQDMMKGFTAPPEPAKPARRKPKKALGLVQS